MPPPRTDPAAGTFRRRCMTSSRNSALRAGHGDRLARHRAGGDLKRTRAAGEAAVGYAHRKTPKRAEVRDYPTDFAAMKRADLDRIALRGEILTRFLVAYYLPDL